MPTLVLRPAHTTTPRVTRTAPPITRTHYAGGPATLGGLSLDQSDFKYSAYLERLVLILGLNWFKPTKAVVTNPVVHFQILRDGTVTNARIVVSSGVPLVDRAALRAVLVSSPLPPLPADYGRPDIGIQVVFD